MNKCEKWNFGNWKLNLEIGILKNYLKMRVFFLKKINKFEDQIFEK